MREKLLEYLRCPSCAAQDEINILNIGERRGEQIIEGTLVTKCCQLRIPIRRGVPRFIEHQELAADKAATAENFGWEWKHFQRKDEKYAEQLLGWLSPVEPSFFKDKIVLEGGCGKGRHTHLAAEWGAREVVSVDLSDAVDVAFDATKDRDNVHVIQADILQLPLKRAFDYAFSVGVLHHMPVPEAGFLALSSKIKPLGHISAWVYGAENNRWITTLVNPIRKHITSRMDKRALFQLAKVPTAAVFLATKLVYGPLNASKTPELRNIAKKLFYNDYLASLSSFEWAEQHHIVFDQLVAPTAFYIPREEFETWWQKAGVTNPVISQHNANSWRGFGQIP